MHNRTRDSVVDLTVQYTCVDPIWGQRTVCAEIGTGCGYHGRLALPQ